MKDNERFSYYAEADIFVITSDYYEETSLASVEALTVGTPALVTKEVELPLIAESQAGFMTNGGIAESVSALKAIIKNKNTYSRNASILAYRYYDISIVTDKLIRYYKYIHI